MYNRYKDTLKEIKKIKKVLQHINKVVDITKDLDNAIR
jgi:hypothetical protein